MAERIAIGTDCKRVIGIFAHIDAGKTTTSEGILYVTGRIHRRGRVDDGDTQLDWMMQERERGITITSAATRCTWRDAQINLIDTPGHVDFSAEVLRSMRVIDGAVIVLCGVGGVEPQTEAVWLQAERAGLPRLVLVNKLDRAGADLQQVLDQLHRELTPHAIPLQMPIGREGAFTGVVDLVAQRAFTWTRGETQPLVGPPPDDLAVDVAAARTAMIEALCEADPALMEIWVSGQELREADLRAAIRRGTLTGQIVPVLCGSALHGMGIQPLLDAIVDYLPSPLDRPVLRGGSTTLGEAITNPDAPEAPFIAAAFKIVNDPYVGHMTWVRVLSGRLHTGEAVLNPRARDPERVSRLYLIHANRREQVEEIAAGDVVALVGVRSAVTGDALCDPAHPITLESATFPEPVIMVALTPLKGEDADRLHRAAAALCAEDPTLALRYDPETHEQTLAGLGELHLEVAVDRLRSEYGIVPQVSAPEIAYRETILGEGAAWGIYRKQSGGVGHFAQVRVRVSPLGRGAGIAFENASAPPKASGQGRGKHAGIPPSCLNGAELGIRQALAKGISAGFPLTDLQVTVLEGQFHEVDSSPLDFQIAGALAVREALRNAHPAMLEPVMRIDIAIAEEHLGTVAADLARRRGKVKATHIQGRLRQVTGEVPLAEVRGYATDLRDFTHGRGTFGIEFCRQELVPEAVMERIVAQRQASGKIAVR